VEPGEAKKPIGGCSLLPVGASKSQGVGASIHLVLEKPGSRSFLQ